MHDKPEMIVDAYNVMHSDRKLEELMSRDLEAARDTFVASLVEYCAREGQELTLVFDAGGRKGSATSEKVTARVSVVYTAQGQSADDYIERLIYKGNRPFASAIVVTADYAEQRVAQGAGVVRMTPREFLESLGESRQELERDITPARRRSRGAKLADHLPEETRAALDNLRRQQKPH